MTDQQLKEPTMVKPESPSGFKTLSPANIAKPLQRLSRAPAGAFDHVSKDWKSRLRIGGWGSFIALVMVPTLFAFVYYAFIASDQYESEARFIVRSSEKPQVGGLGALLQTTGLGPAQEETYSVLDYMASRDALRDVQAVVDYQALMGRDFVDFLSAFPNMIDGATFEGMFDHYTRHVTPKHDTTSGISTVTVRAFTPEDAQAIATALLDNAEKLINRMNQRSREDSLTLARDEVRNAEQRVLDNQLRLKAFRVKEGIVDPEVASKAALELIGELTGEQAKLETQLRLIKEQTPSSVQIQVLQKRLDALVAQLDQERAKLVSQNGSLVGTYAEYEQLVLEQEFAAKALLTAQANLASARVEAARKQLYLERIVEPNAPDDARYPQRLLRILTVFMTFFLGYAIIWLLYVNAREHKH
ncbi:hypothetical protein GWI72_08780 [Microvirga tunisiensis]|uniref:Uncharacterized protein n=2 Tax=Pannonibacter tanglangensis TaxID=2750084 RepID=A0A7X5J863_9HYPH|nr:MULTISPECIES: hypothetical protein [unclassified Pannonibacter]NBN62704.1 hypothetical protein [Pannonibacter sp. XCT-34]NBN78359.1 hypothetical protein [Pannonibacter sp. XCT-53]